jgi:hypothetical protein
LAAPRDQALAEVGSEVSLNAYQAPSETEPTERSCAQKQVILLKKWKGEYQA